MTQSNLDEGRDQVFMHWGSQINILTFNGVWQSGGRTRFVGLGGHRWIYWPLMGVWPPVKNPLKKSLPFAGEVKIFSWCQTMVKSVPSALKRGLTSSGAEPLEKDALPFVGIVKIFCWRPNHGHKWSEWPVMGVWPFEGQNPKKKNSLPMQSAMQQRRVARYLLLIDQW